VKIPLQTTKNKIKILGGIVLLFILTSFPSALLALFNQGISLTTVIIFLISLSCIAFLWYYISNQLKVFSPPFQGLHSKSKKSKIFSYLGLALLGVFLLLIAQIPSMWGISNQEISRNQTLWNTELVRLPIILVFIALSFAPFFEEVIFRFGIFALFQQGKRQIIAYLLSVILFILPHMLGSFDNLQAWLSYGGSAIVLTSFYAYFRNIYLNITIHFFYNLIMLIFWCYQLHLF
jgi:membrane protease YdiL (CAAX protease family)